MNDHFGISDSIYEVVLSQRNAAVDPLSWSARIRARYPAPEYGLVTLIHSGDTGYVIARRGWARVTKASWRRINDLIRRRGIQRQLAIQGNVIEWFGQRVQSKAGAYCLVIVHPLCRIQLGQVAANDDTFKNITSITSCCQCLFSHFINSSLFSLI